MATAPVQARRAVAVNSVFFRQYIVTWESSHHLVSRAAPNRDQPEVMASERAYAGSQTALVMGSAVQLRRDCDEGGGRGDLVKLGLDDPVALAGHTFESHPVDDFHVPPVVVDETGPLKDAGG